MPNPQFIRASNGEELVVLSRAEYDALVAAAEGDEDAADLEVFDRRMADLSAGRDARLPPEVSALVHRGDSVLKALRTWRDMTQMHLAFKTNLAQGYLSDLETGRRKGTQEAMRLIAKALDVDPSWLSSVERTENR